MSLTETASATYRERMARLAALTDAMPTGVTVDINDDTALAMMQAIERVKRGTR